MKSNHTNTSLAIVTWHQVYMPAAAGGYVRLKEFLRRFPKEINFVLLDNKKTLYSDLVPGTHLIEYQSPRWISALQKKNFILWFLLETVSSTILLYTLCSNLVKKENIKVFYFPTAEFSQLYLTSLLLKLRYPQIKVILDILNYGLLEDNYANYFIKLLKNGSGLIRSIAITLTIFSSSFLMKCTISHADYIVTVSKRLVKKIKKDYKKNTIDYTPSGVSMPKNVSMNTSPKYLACFIGRMTLEKGVFDALLVWEKVVKRIPYAKLALAGHADPMIKDVILRELKEKKLEKNVIFFGDVTEEVKHKILSESELFIHLAHKEPLFPVITILEGFAFALPAIVYQMPVVNETIEELRLPQKGIYIAQNENIEEVVQYLLAYEHLSTDKKEIAKNDARACAKKFDWETIAKKEFGIIAKLIHESI